MIPQAFLSRPVSAATQMKPSLPHQLDQEFLQGQAVWLLDHNSLLAQISWLQRRYSQL